MSIVAAGVERLLRPSCFFTSVASFNSSSRLVRQILLDPLHRLVKEGLKRFSYLPQYRYYELYDSILIKTNIGAEI